MTDPVLSQLVSVESGLAEQVEQVETLLSQLQTKRRSLLTVIDLFQDEGKSTPAVAKAPSSKAALQTATPQTATLQAATPQTAIEKSPARTAAKTKRGRMTSTKPRSAELGAKLGAKAGAKSGTKSASMRKSEQQTADRKKKDGRAAAWQKHVQPDYRDLALPESVSSVLRSQPAEVFKIADVMSSIFKEDMPRTSYLKARNRISNILSAGARDGTWYRGSNGRYSQSEKVTKL